MKNRPKNACVHRSLVYCLTFSLTGLVVSGNAGAQADANRAATQKQAPKKNAATNKSESLLDRYEEAQTALKKMARELTPVRRAVGLNAAANARRVRDQNLRTLTTFVQRKFTQELNVIGSVASMDEDTLADLRQKTTPAVNEFVKELADEDLTRYRSLYIQPGRPPQALVERVVNFARDAVDESMIDEYRTDLDTRDEFRREAAIKSAVVAVDQQVALDAAQFAKVEALIRENWDTKYNRNAQRLLQTNYPSAFPVPEDRLVPLLTLKQQAAYQLMRTTNLYSVALSSASGRRTSGKKQDPEKMFRTELNRAADLRIAALDRQFSLTDSQKEKLRVLGKGVAADAMRLVTAALENRRKATTNRRALAAAGARMAIDPTLAYVLMSRPGALLLDQPLWATYRDRVLTAEQKKEWNALQLKLDEYAREAMVDSYICNMDSQMGLSGRQLREFSEVYLAVVPPLNGARRYTYDSNLKLVDIPRDRLQKILNVEQYSYLSRVMDSLDRRRQMVEEARKAREQALLKPANPNNGKKVPQ